MQSLAIILSADNDPGISFDQLKEAISDMILNDFRGLINLLYRIDVDEEQLRRMLADGSTDSAALIANSILKRVEQKRLARRHTDFTKDIPEDERW